MGFLLSQWMEYARTRQKYLTGKLQLMHLQGWVVINAVRMSH